MEAEVEVEMLAGMLAAEVGLRCARRGRSRRARRCYTRTARTAAWPKWPGPQPPMRPTHRLRATNRWLRATLPAPAAQDESALAATVPERGCGGALVPIQIRRLTAFDHSRQGSAELLRTYGFVEPSPYTRVAVTLDELLNTATRLRATRGRGGRAPLSAPRARHRATALERAGLLPAGGIFLVGAAADVDPGLLTAVQVLAMTEAEFDEWAAAGGGIALGPEFLDEEHLPDVVACLLGVVAEQLLLRRRAPESAGEGGAAAGEKAGEGGSGGGGGAGGGGGGSAAATELSQALKREEKAVLEALRAAVLRLEPADDDEGEEEDEDESGEEEGDDDEGDDGEEGEAAGEEGAGDGQRQDAEAGEAGQKVLLVGRKRGRRP